MERRDFTPNQRQTLNVLGLLSTRTQVRFVVRYNPDRPYLSSDVLVDGDGIEWSVEGAALIGRRQFVELYCVRRTLRGGIQ